MNTKMSYGGIGPKLALITLPYIILSASIMIQDHGFLRFTCLNCKWINIIGIILICIGLVFYVSSAIVFLKEFKKGKLITRGPYSLCQNPIYASIIVFIIPGAGLVYNSGLLLSIALVLYVNLKISIHGENVVLLRNFGKEYENYSKMVNEVFPFPGFKMRKLIARFHKTLDITWIKSR